MTVRESLLRGRPRPGVPTSWLRVALLGLLLSAVGCSTAPRGKAWTPQSAVRPTADVVARAKETVCHLWPDRYQATQRAVLTVGRKEFVLDAFLASDPEQGLHLAIVSTLGVVTEVQRETNGACHILKTTALLPESWARQYVAQDLTFLFAPPDDLEIIGSLNDQHVVLGARQGARQQRFLCTPDGSRLEALEVVEDGRRTYCARFSRPQLCPGSTAAVPLQIEADAGRYQLNIRTVQLRAPGMQPSAAAHDSPEAFHGSLTSETTRLPAPERSALFSRYRVPHGSATDTTPR